MAENRTVIRTSLDELSRFLCAQGPITINRIWSAKRCAACAGPKSYFASYAPIDSSAEIVRLHDDIETAWGIIANAHHGDWERASQDWRKAAERWRDEAWHRIALASRAQDGASKQKDGD